MNSLIRLQKEFYPIVFKCCLVLPCQCCRIPSFFLPCRHSTYIYQDSKSSQLIFSMQQYIQILPSWSGAKIECTVHVVLPRLSINQFKPVMLSRQQAPRAYFPNIYTVPAGKAQIFFFFFACTFPILFSLLTMDLDGRLQNTPMKVSCLKFRYPEKATFF